MVPVHGRRGLRAIHDHTLRRRHGDRGRIVSRYHDGGRAARQAGGPGGSPVGFKVPREYSDRQIHDEIQDKKVFIPMMEMSKGERAKHGPYVIEEVQLIAKDKTIAAAYAPDDGERYELVVVVQPTIEVAIFDATDVSNEHQRLLNEVGFAPTHSPEEVPNVFTVALGQAILGRIMRFYADINLRFIATEARPTSRPYGRAAK